VTKFLGCFTACLAARFVSLLPPCVFACGCRPYRISSQSMADRAGQGSRGRTFAPRSPAGGLNGKSTAVTTAETERGECGGPDGSFEPERGARLVLARKEMLMSVSGSSQRRRRRKLGDV